MTVDPFQKKYLVRFANLEKMLFLEAVLNDIELGRLESNDKYQILSRENLKGVSL